MPIQTLPLNMAANNNMGGAHLALYTYEALVANISGMIGVNVTQRDLAQPTANIVEHLYIKFIRAIFALDFEDYLQDLYELPDQVSVAIQKARVGH